MLKVKEMSSRNGGSGITSMPSMNITRIGVPSPYRDKSRKLNGEAMAFIGLLSLVEAAPGARHDYGITG